MRTDPRRMLFDPDVTLVLDVPYVPEYADRASRATKELEDGITNEILQSVVANNFQEYFRAVYLHNVGAYTHIMVGGGVKCKRVYDHNCYCAGSRVGNGSVPDLQPGGVREEMVCCGMRYQLPL